MKKSVLFGVLGAVVGVIAGWLASLIAVGVIFGLLGFDEYQADQYSNLTFIISLAIALLGGLLLGFLGFSFGKNLAANNNANKK